MIAGPEQSISGQAAREVWARIGAGFFQALAEHLSRALDAQFVWIGEVFSTPVERMRAVASYAGESLRQDADSARDAIASGSLAGTASAAVISAGMAVHERDVRRIFPSDPVLQAMRAEAYAGMALTDSYGHPIGLVAVLFRHPLADSSFARSMLQAFAPRAAAELERKRADDALRESEQRYRVFIERNADAMWRIEFEQPIPIDLPEDEQIERIMRYGYLAECNEALIRLVQVAGPDWLTGARLIGLRVRDLVKYLDPQIIEVAQTALHSGYQTSNIEVRPLDRQGNRLYRLRSQFGIVENGKLCRIWGTSRDIGALRKAESERESAEIRFRSVLENIRMAAVILDPSGEVTFCNDYASGLTGWPKSSMTGRNWFDLTSPEEHREELKALFAECIQGVRDYDHFERVLVTRDGARRRVEMDSIVLHDSTGKIAGVAVLGRDITEQIALEAQLRQAQKLESLGRLAGGIAHDFNNLLTVINGYADVLLEEHGWSDPLHDAVLEIRRAGQRGSEMARQLLSFSRKQPVSARPLNLTQLVEENRNMLDRLTGSDIELVTNLDPSPGLVLADPGQIYQVLMNLLVNARDAMPFGGTVSISSSKLELQEADPAHMPGVPPGTYVILTVSDTGVGMTEDVRARVFEPFFTTKQPGNGTGLGLSTVYGIVRQSGGYIFVESEPGKGTTFRIVLPRAQGSL
jgi:two-component system cell cycle sensor histidine kinase/response regulator CckA